jgi:hypothetical protein
MRLASHSDPALRLLLDRETSPLPALERVGMTPRTDKSRTLKKIEHWWGQPVHSIVKQCYASGLEPMELRLHAICHRVQGYTREAELMTDCAEALEVAQRIRERRACAAASRP